eukprot:COSAG02_NODE_188_length_30307_cov_341.858746_8_plen_538_part_00
MRAGGLCTLGLHAPPRDARRRNPWGHADPTFHKGSHNQGHAPSAGAFHRSQNSVIVDGVSDPLGELPPPPTELELAGDLVARHAPTAPQPLNAAHVLNSGPYIGGDSEAAAEEAWQIAQVVGAGAFEEGPDPSEEQEYRARARPPPARSARVGAGPGLAGESGGVYGVGLEEQMIAESAAAASYHSDRTADGPYKAPSGLRRTSRPDVHFLASPRAAAAADAPDGVGEMGRTLQDLLHAKSSGMKAKGGSPQVAPLAVDSYWPNNKGVPAGRAPGGNNPMIDSGQQLVLSKAVERRKKVPNLWGHGGRADDVEKREMTAIDDVAQYIAAIRDKPPSPPPKRNLGGEAVAQMLPDYPLPPPVPSVTPAGCVKPSRPPDDDHTAGGEGGDIQSGIHDKSLMTKIRADDDFRAGYATAAATRAAAAAAASSQADAKLRDAQVYMATHSHQVWDPSTGSYAVRKGKPLGEAVGHRLAPASSSLSSGGSRVVLAAKDPAPGLVAETTTGQYGSYAPSRGAEEIRYSGIGHQTASTGAPTRSC